MGFGRERVRHIAPVAVVAAWLAFVAGCGGAHSSVQGDGNVGGEPDGGADGDADEGYVPRPDADVAEADCDVDCDPFEWVPPPPCDPDCRGRGCGLDPVCRELRCGDCEEPSTTCSLDGACVANPCPDGMVPVDLQASPGRFCIDRYEASEGDRGAARSAGGVMPWVDLTWHAARLACDLADKRLCTSEEWEAACGGPERLAYPYGTSYHPYRCNGVHNDIGALAPTGYLDLCEGGYPGLFDMSGNAMEWTATCPSALACHLRGGAFSGTIVGRLLGCFEGGGGRIAPEAVAWQNVSIGFRCCLDL